MTADIEYDLHTIAYTYDALSRLTAARYNPAGAVGSADADLLRLFEYSYDLAGNRTAESVAINGGSPTTTTYTYNAANQIINNAVAELEKVEVNIKNRDWTEGKAWS